MSWKRKLFFILDKLKINPAERISVSILSALLVAVTAVNVWLEPEVPFAESDYAELREQFNRQTVAAAEQEQKKLDRYQPDKVVPKMDTIPGDTTDTTEAEQQQSEGVSEVPDKININTADAQVLQQLDGIGPVYAERIVAYRKERGDFEAKEELKNIKGIGEKRLEKLKPFVKL